MRDVQKSHYTMLVSLLIGSWPLDQIAVCLDLTPSDT